MILLWGLPGDGPISAVRRVLEGLGAPVFFLDQRRALETHAELSVGSRVEGTLRVGGRTLALEDITAAYLRPHDSRRLPEVECAGPGSAAWNHVSWLEDLLFSWAELTSACVINRPSDMAPNGSKPFQATQIKPFGFRTPATLITTEPEAVREFQARHGTLIYKSISGIRSIVSRLTPEREGRLDCLRWCPTQFQQQVPGEDFRVHVVGEAVFAARIVSTADDYRYASRQRGHTDIERAELPTELVDRCRRMAHALHLPVAGIDLRRTPEGEWYCFEINPSPGFTYFQDATGDGIDQAVAELLRTGATA
jgi:ribosomal protein S6-L-glutamate ligase RimK-like protein